MGKVMRINHRNLVDGHLYKNRFNRLTSLEHVKGSEKWFGYLIGPAGPLMLNTVFASYLNLYYTDVWNMTPYLGGMFLVILPIVSKILTSIFMMAMGQILERTGHNAGKARPWLLRAAPLVSGTGILLFLIPRTSEWMQMLWVFLSYNLFFSFSYTIYSMSHSMILPLSTRNSEERGRLSVFSNISQVAVTGIIASLLFPVFVLPQLGTDRGRWILVMGLCSVIAFPLIILEYLFTRERISEEHLKGEKNKEPTTVTTQFKMAVKNKYWVLLMIYFMVNTIGTNFRTASLIYYCNYVLGNYNDGVTQALVNAVGGFPMGIGMFLAWPLAKRFGKKNCILAGTVLMVIGGCVCLIAPGNMAVVLAGQIIKNTGAVPASYLLLALFSDVLEHMEYTAGIRLDGISMSIYNVILTVGNGICLSAFNLFLFRLGYVAPVFDAVAGITKSHVQNQAVQFFFIFGFVGLEVLLGGAMIVILSKLNVERELREMNRTYKEIV